MTRNELYTILQRCGWETTAIHTLDKIWGRAFDGETEKITPQSISTAPKGTRILLYCQRSTSDEGWWEIGQFYGQENRWMNDEDEPKLGQTQPTLWLPLPPLPTPHNPK